MNSKTDNKSNSEKEKLVKELEKIKKEIDNNTITKEQLFNWYKEEIQRKDELISKLRKDNELLFKTAMKSNEREINKFDKVSSNEGK